MGLFGGGGGGGGGLGGAISTGLSGGVGGAAGQLFNSNVFKGQAPGGVFGGFNQGIGDPLDIWGNKAAADNQRQQDMMAQQRADIQAGIANRPEYQSMIDPTTGKLQSQYTAKQTSANVAKNKVTQTAKLTQAEAKLAKAHQGTAGKSKVTNAQVNKAAIAQGKAETARAQNATTSSIDWAGLDTRMNAAKDISVGNVGYTGDVNAGANFGNAQTDYGKLRTEAFGTGPTAWATAMGQQQDLNRASALDQLTRDNRNQSAQAMNDLAMQGGLEGGARERIAKASSRDAMLANQSLFRQDASARLGITGQDEQQRMAMRQALPGMGLTLDQYNTGLAEQNRAVQNNLNTFNSQQSMAQQAQNQQLAMSKANEWAGLQESQASRDTANSQFNAGQQNANSQFNTGQLNSMNQFNASALNSGNQFNAAAANQVGMFNAGQQTQNSQFNTGQANAMSQFNANALNSNSQFNAGAQNQVGMFNAGQANQTSQFNTGQVNANNQFNTSQQNSMNQFNAGQANQIGMFNTGNTIGDNRASNQYKLDAWGQGMQAMGAAASAGAMANQQPRNGMLSGFFGMG